MSDLDEVRAGLVPGRMLPALAYTSEEVLAGSCATCTPGRGPVSAASRSCCPPG